MESEVPKGAASRYAQLMVERDMFLTRARESSKLTLPSLVPPAGHSGSNDLYKPFQSLGARGVNNLAAKLLMTLFPPNTPFQRFKINEIELERQVASDPEFKSNLDEALAKSERAIQDEIETTGIRATAFEAMKLLVVSGNVLTHEPREGGMRAYHLSQYVVNRDPSGNLLEAILKEMISPSALPEIYQKYCAKATDPTNTVEKSLELFTWMKLVDGHWEVHQECSGVIIQETYGSYPKESFPWQALRWTKIQGENYGRGHVEELYGDLQSLEGLTRAIVEGSAAAAKLLFLVAPNGNTTAAAVAKTPNGGFATGSKDDITVLQLEKFNDFRVALETINGISSRLEKAFLLNSSIQRSGERVTAEEIRFMAQELETALGGTYALLSQEFQLPLVKALIAGLTRKGLLPKMPKSIRPTIVTGLEALGRSNDLTKLDDFVKEISQLLGPNAVAQFINPIEYLKRRATALGIDTKNLVRTQQEVDASNQQAQQQAAMQQIAPNLTKGAADLLKNHQTLQAQAATPAT